MGGNLIISFVSDDSGWWTGKNKGKEGYFPGSYVEKI